MRIMIFDTFVSGHHLEYLHHLYTYEDNKNEYVLVVPEDFNRVKNKFEWINKKNITFDYIDTKLIDVAHSSGHLLKSIRLSRILYRYIKKHNIDNVFLISLIDYYPLLPIFFFMRKIKVSGILYKIYLYEWKNYSIYQKIYELLRNAMIAVSAHVVFVLNDAPAAVYLNRLWKTQCFNYLIDPYIPFEEDKLFDIRKALNIPLGVNLFCHLGSMDKRKGTLDILEAIRLIEERCYAYFLFAGKIGAEIRDQFYSSYNTLKYKERVIVRDQFCTYEFLGSVSKSCDCMLLPYKRTSLSSGFVYYALQFKKNVIGGTNGLLGKLVKRYQLGKLMNNVSPSILAEEILNFEKTNVPQVDMTSIHPSKFAEQILTTVTKNG